MLQTTSGAFLTYSERTSQKVLTRLSTPDFWRK